MTVGKDKHGAGMTESKELTFTKKDRESGTNVRWEECDSLEK